MATRDMTVTVTGTREDDEGRVEPIEEQYERADACFLNVFRYEEDGQVRHTCMIEGTIYMSMWVETARRIMKNLSDDDARAFVARIWEACTDMLADRKKM